jgi:hypothetical protein
MLPVINDPHAISAHPTLHFAWAKNWAVRQGDWKLICKPSRESNQAVYSLHNLAEPMPEVKDHSQDEPAKVQDFIAIHEAWEKDVSAK